MKTAMQELGMFYPSSITLIVFNKEYKNYKPNITLFDVSIEMIRLKKGLNQDKELLNQYNQTYNQNK
jgi:hypothetical protein